MEDKTFLSTRTQKWRLNGGKHINSDWQSY
jgi:hypothetical protein